MMTIAPSFLIRSSSFLQVTRTCIKLEMNLNFRNTRQPTSELPALECLKICLRFFWVAVHQIFFKLAGNKENTIFWMSLNFGQIGPPTIELAVFRAS